VLVVDDHSAVRIALRQLVAELDGFVHVGIELAQRAQPDLVLLDVHLPGIDGIEVCRRLRATIPSAITILMTADPAAPPASAASACGAAALVRKQDLQRRRLLEIWEQANLDVT
jgi:two-component system invasion response regulator UvrY